MYSSCVFIDLFISIENADNHVMNMHYIRHNEYVLIDVYCDVDILPVSSHCSISVLLLYV